MVRLAGAHLRVPPSRPGSLGLGWAMFAYRGWLRLSWLDEKVLSKVVPAALFYNVCVTGTKPDRPPRARADGPRSAAGRGVGLGEPAQDADVEADGDQPRPVPDVGEHRGEATSARRRSMRWTAVRARQGVRRQARSTPGDRGGCRSTSRGQRAAEAHGAAKLSSTRSASSAVRSLAPSAEVARGPTMRRRCSAATVRCSSVRSSRLLPAAGETCGRAEK